MTPKLKLCKTKQAPNVGEFCFAKVRGYAEWPARVESIDGNHALVTFFNPSTFAKCTFNKIFDLKEGIQFLGKYFNKNKGFTKAAKEMSFVIRDKAQISKAFSANEVVKKYIELLE